jgi:CheY-like chemotaxis protein
VSIYRRAARTDENQATIVAALREAGAAVWCIRFPLDLLVAFRGAFYLLDCKMPGKDFDEGQKRTLRLLESVGCSAVAAHDAEEALEAIGASLDSV